ncbi:pentapeptide repeat-containing protein [Streptomyces coelicoflavus]|uniref:pentapeptide repeat-containing protein n=1 Tax=Streptomyces coelicoflavus TaxID=285562 RepID=UPI0036C4908F
MPLLGCRGSAPQGIGGYDTHVALLPFARVGFAGAVLAGAALTGVVLSGVVLSGVVLSGVVLTGAVRSVRPHGCVRPVGYGCCGRCAHRSRAHVLTSPCRAAPPSAR